MKVLEKGIYARLSGDATLTSLAPGGVWRGVAPVDATGVVVVFSQSSALDSYTLADRAMTEHSYVVKAIAPGESAAPAWDAADQIDALLTDQTITLDSGSVLACRRDTIVSLTETDGGEQYQHVGGIYRITTQEAA